MEQARGEQQQQEQPPTPLRCPRCNSLDTRFRYFNNHSPTQPRHSCKTCKRQWTVGGNLRNVPIGGKPRSAKQTKASSSRSVNSRCQPQQSPLPFVQEYLQDSPFLGPMAAQNFNSSIIQQQTSPRAPISRQSSYHFNDEISCLDAIQSLIQPEAHVNAGNQFGNIGANMGIPQEWNIQPMASHEPFSQRLTGCLGSHQNYNQVNNVPHSELYEIRLAKPTRPINSLPQGIPTDFDVSTSNPFMLNNNFMGNTTDPEIDTTSVNVDEWLNLSDHE